MGATQTRTLRLILELGQKGTFKAPAGELRETGKAAQATQRALDDLGRSAGPAKAEASIKNLASTRPAIDGMVGSLKNLATGFIGLQGAQMALDWSKQGAANQGVATSFDNLATAAGRSSKTMLNELRTASQGMVSDAALMEGANKAMLLGGERLASALPKLLQIAQASAKATGQEMQFVFDSLVTGLARNSKMIIDNAGITVDVAKANEVYAVSIGKTVDALSDQEKAMAFQNAVMAQGEQFITKLGTAADDNATKIAQAGVAWDNFWNSAKGEAANFVVAELEGIKLAAMWIEGFGGQMDVINAKALSGKNTYAEYVAALRAVGEEGRAMSEAQFNAALALTKTGTDAQAAAANVQNLADVEGNIAHAFRYSADTMGINAQAQAALMAQSMELASKSEYLHGKVFELAEAFSYSGDVDTFRAGIEKLSEAQERGAVQAKWLGDMFGWLKEQQAAGIDMTAAAIDISYEQAFALASTENAAIASGIAQQQLAFDTQMTRDAASAAIGMYAAQEGSLYAMATAARQAGDDLAYMAMMAAQAQLSRSTAMDRAELKMMGIDPKDQAAYKGTVAQRAQDIVNPAAAAARQSRAMADAAAFNRQLAASNKTSGGRGGSRGGTGRAAGGGAGRSEDSPAESAAKAAAEAGRTAESMSKLKGFIAPTQADIDAYTTALAQMTASYHARSQEIGYALVESTTKFATISGEVVASAGKGVDVLGKLRDYESPARANLLGFSYDMRDITADFWHRAQEVGYALDESTSVFAKTAGDAVATIADGVAGFAALKDYARPPRENLEYFSKDLRDTVADFWHRAQEIGYALADEAAPKFAEQAARAVGVIGDGVEAFTKLQTYKGIPQAALDSFGQDLTQAIRLMDQTRQQFDAEGMPAAAAFAASVGQIIAPIGSAVDAFSKLQEYQGVPQARMGTMFIDMRQAINLMVATSNMADQEGVKAAAAFSTSVSSVFGAISSGVDALGGLAAYESVPRERMDAFKADFTGAVGVMQDLNGLSGSMASQGETWAKNLSTFADNIKAGIDSIASIDGMSVNVKANVSASAAAGGAGANIEARALGGPVKAGQSYLVGERGPEIFTPRAAGNIMSNSDLASQARNGMRSRGAVVGPSGGNNGGSSGSGRSGGASITIQAVPGMITINAPGGDPRTVERAVAKALNDWEERQKAETRAALRGR